MSNTQGGFKVLKSNTITVLALLTALTLTGCPTTPPTPPPTSPTWTLSVSKTGDGNITSSPASINCGSTCVATYPDKTNVTLTAAPPSGSSFTGWSGACSGSNLTCTITMDANKTVSASFTVIPVPPPSAPFITITQPTPNQVVTTSSLHVTGTVFGTVATLRYEDNSGIGNPLTPSNAFSFDVGLNPGSNTIKVFAKNASNPEVTSSVIVSYTPTPSLPCTSFTLEPTYPANATSFIVAQRADALYKVKITNRNNCAIQAPNFSSATITGTNMGTGANQVKATFRPDLSSGDDLAFVLVGGSSAPIGTYNVTVSANSGTATSTTNASVQVTECTLGCP
jgi:Divergent InlB B-repeat domain